MKQQQQNGLSSSASSNKIVNSELHHMLHQPATNIATGATAMSSYPRLASSNLDYQKLLLSMGRQQQHQLAENRIEQVVVNNNNSKPVNSKMSEVEKIKQELLGYQREIEMMQKQREAAKMLKQQKLLEQQKSNSNNNNHVNGNHSNSTSNKEQFDADHLAALHQTHHQHHSMQHQIKSNNQINEAAIHSKPINYDNQNYKLNNGSFNNDVNNKLNNNNNNNKKYVNNINNNNDKEEEDIEDGECSRQEENDDQVYEGQEYILETYKTNNLMSKKKSINQQQESKLVNDDSIDVSNLINQFRSMPITNQDNINATSTSSSSSATAASSNNNSETIKIV
jgi:hypothetical protein